MYFNKDKKYVEIMAYRNDEEIEKYRVLKTDKEALGWETVGIYEVTEINGVRYIDESMIKVLRTLIYFGYEVLGKKEK